MLMPLLRTGVPTATPGARGKLIYKVYFAVPGNCRSPNSITRRTVMMTATTTTMPTRSLRSLSSTD
jgi:hypothetical protein